MSPLLPAPNILILYSLFIPASDFLWQINPLNLPVSTHWVMWKCLDLCKLCDHNKLVNFLWPFISLTPQSRIADLFHVVLTWIWTCIWFNGDYNFLDSCPVNICGCENSLLPAPSMVLPNLFTDRVNKDLPWDFSPEEREQGQIYTIYHLLLLPFVFFWHSFR